MHPATDHKRLRRTIRFGGGTMAAMLAVVTFAPSGALAAKGGGEEVYGNNLSVPAIFAGATTGMPALRTACENGAKNPGGDGSATSDTFPGYWLQKTAATWTADCAYVPSGPVDVLADWGDNLTNENAPSAGRPIRVEVALLTTPTDPMKGYLVEKLQPDLEDRASAYGTKGTELSTVTGTPARVWDGSASLKIQRAGSTPVYDGPMSAEINSTGGIVFGYNWGIKGAPPTPGTYTITFSVNGEHANITGSPDAAAVVDSPASTHLTVTLGSGVGGGGGRGGRG